MLVTCLPFPRIKCREHLQCDEVEGVNGLLAGAVALARLAEAALSAAPVLRGEDEGGEPEVGEDEVERSQVAAVSADKGQEGTDEPEAQGNRGLIIDMLVCGRAGGMGVCKLDVRDIQCTPGRQCSRHGSRTCGGTRTRGR